MTSFRIVRNQVVLTMTFDYLVKSKARGFYVVDRHVIRGISLPYVSIKLRPYREIVIIWFLLTNEKRTHK